MIKNNKKSMVAVAGLICMAFISGCGGGSDSSTSPSVSGKVADGYLQNALVFLDRDLDYQLDDGEPSTRTDASGAYTLDVTAEDIGLYPIVAVAIAGETIDLDPPAKMLTQSYVLCTPAAGVSGTVSNFISPMSTLLREKLEATPGMTLTEAMIQLRNQMDLPVGMNLMGDYMVGSTSGQYQNQYQAMHQTAQQMAGIMADQAGLVMSGTDANAPRFRAMMGEINQTMSQITDAAGTADMEALRTEMRSRMQTRLSGIGATSGFNNYSSLFRNMTGHSSFWNYSGGIRQPRSGMMQMFGN